MRNMKLHEPTPYHERYACLIFDYYLKILVVGDLDVRLTAMLQQARDPVHSL